LGDIFYDLPRGVKPRYALLKAGEIYAGEYVLPHAAKAKHTIQGRRTVIITSIHWIGMRLSYESL
jgi:hypothetical protein